MQNSAILNTLHNIHSALFSTFSHLTSSNVLTFLRNELGKLAWTDSPWGGYPSGIISLQEMMVSLYTVKNKYLS